jgi:sulfite reductase alpha subunit-like flavoprotein
VSVTQHLIFLFPFLRTRIGAAVPSTTQHLVIDYTVKSESRRHGPDMSQTSSSSSFWAELTAVDYALLIGLLLVGWLYLRSTNSKASSSASKAAPVKKAVNHAKRSESPATTTAAAAAAGSTSQSSTGYALIDRLGSRKVLVFYGSQTGTAEEYASRLAKEAAQYGLRAMTADLMDYDVDDLRFLPPGKLVMFALATYGEGEPTDNARDFHEWLMSDDREAEREQFEQMHYVLFG